MGFHIWNSETETTMHFCYSNVPSKSSIVKNKPISCPIGPLVPERYKRRVGRLWESAWIEVWVVSWGHHSYPTLIPSYLVILLPCYSSSRLVNCIYIIHRGHQGQIYRCIKTKALVLSVTLNDVRRKQWPVQGLRTTCHQRIGTGHKLISPSSDWPPCLTHPAWRGASR